MPLLREELENCMINGLADYTIARHIYGSFLSYDDFIESCIDWNIPYRRYTEYEEY